MKPCYVASGDSWSIVDITRTPTGLHMISTIYTPSTQRGEGHASRLLRKVLADADAEGVPIALVISPSGGLDRPELEAWYGRHGFVYREPEACWIREPR